MANTKIYAGDEVGAHTVEVTSTIDAGAIAGRALIAAGSDYCGASDDCAGVIIGGAVGDTVADDNETVTCQIDGVVAMQAGAALATRFKQVEFDSSGRAIALASGKCRGINLDTADAAGDVIRVLLQPGLPVA